MSYEFVGDDRGDHSGNSFSSAGDVDGDGLDDLLIGASLADGVGNAEDSSGSMYLIAAADLAALDAADGASDGVIDLAYVAPTGTSYEFVGEDASDESGYSVSSAGDVDGDGLGDLLIGARYADGVGNAKDGSGSTYLIAAADLAALDAADGASDGVIDLAYVAPTGTSYEFVGEDAGDNSGYSVSSAGDVDGDGLADLLIGARSADGVGNAETDSGSTYLIAAADLAALDAADGASDGVIDLAYVAPTGTSYEFVGEDASDQSGISVSSAGDVDGDGLADLLIGARSADGVGNAEVSSGSTYLIEADQLAYYDALDGATDGVIDLAYASAGPNSEVSGFVLITGTPEEDETLTADASGLSDEDGFGTLRYQWLRDGVAIDGATSATYQLGQGDVGAEISVTVSYTDGRGTAESVTSAATSAVTNVNDAVTGSVLITGTAAEDETLTADASGLSDGDGLGTFSYQWLRDGVAIDGATSATYQLGQDDVGAEISVTVSYTDGQGTEESVTSAATSAVTNVNDVISGSVLITGTAAEDETLTADASGLSDGDGLGTFSYQWLRDGVAILGATSSTYQLGADDVGAEISVTVSYTDGQGSEESATSAATDTVADNGNMDPTGSVLISGTPAEDERLTADTSGLSDEDGLGAFSYQWLRDGVAIGRATSATYQLGQDDVGAEISVRVSYTDGQGTVETVTSAATSAVTNVNDAVTGSVLMTGTAEEGEVLRANTSRLDDEDGLGTFSYQWLRDGVAIDGATSATYELGPDDVGAEVSVTVSYTDGGGTSESVTSDESLISSIGFSGSSRSDVLQGGLSGTSSAAGDGDDTVSASAGSNVFDGGDGNDLLIGGIDGDELIGGAGNDILIGDVTTHVAGADVLDGGAGDDLMEGGAGSDTFVFRPDEGSDTIGSIDLDYDDPSSSTISGADFESGVDMIALSGFDFTDGSDALDAVSDVNGVATFSADGTTITFAGLSTADLTADDFQIL